MMTEIGREEVLKANSLVKHMESLGIKLKKEGVERVANRCAKTQHAKTHFCVSVNVDKEIFHCNDCQVGGSVIDWIAIESNKNPLEVFREMAMALGGKNEEFRHTQRDRPSVTPNSSKVVKTYDYTDEQGNLIYQVVRYEPKDFRQRKPDGKGGWDWSMEGVTRVLYRLASVLKAQLVVCAEGEKDCDTLVELGFVATCNVGGAEKWLGAYSDFLAGKDIIIVPDNDEKGVSHAKIIADSLEDKANSIKVVAMPKPYKDSTEFVQAQPDKLKAAEAIREMFEKAPHTLKPLPLFSIQELERMYTKFQEQPGTNSISLGNFLPSFNAMRPFIPGEVIMLIASTGVGKTVVAQKIAISASPLPTLFFELELPPELLFERFAQMKNNCDGDEVANYYRVFSKPVSDTFSDLQHVLVCPESGLSPERIEKFIERSALKFGRRPVLVIVDYLGLVRAKGKTRYEITSDAAESLRVIARRTNTVVFSTVQISRPDKKSEGLEVGLYDAKDSGSIENSASLVLGAWRPDRDTLMLKVLKNTKGMTGRTVECNFNGATMSITERSKINADSIPKARTPYLE
jgi:5S rRNA maturation endonuclease (ribonuclease M5)